MAGLGEGRARRVRRLEEEGVSGQTEFSQTEREAYSLTAEIKRLERELEEFEELEGPQDGIIPRSERERKRGEVEIPPHLTLDEEIRFLEESLEDSKDIGE